MRETSRRRTEFFERVRPEAGAISQAQPDRKRAPHPDRPTWSAGLRARSGTLRGSRLLSRTLASHRSTPRVRAYSSRPTRVASCRARSRSTMRRAATARPIPVASRAAPRSPQARNIRRCHVVDGQATMRTRTEDPGPRDHSARISGEPDSSRLHPSHDATIPRVAFGLSIDAAGSRHEPAVPNDTESQ